MSSYKLGYDLMNPGPAGGRGFLLLSNESGGCYYSSGAYGNVNGYVGVFPDSTEYKQSAEELRQYILQLESTRKIQDLSNVRFARNVRPGDALLYNHTTGFWELQEFISGGAW